VDERGEVRNVETDCIRTRSMVGDGRWPDSYARVINNSNQHLSLVRES
jgi:hypothetical protein